MPMTNVPLFPVTVVGSWPRPSYLVDAFRRRKTGRISFEDLNKLADQAVVEALRYQVEAGVDIVSDGEQRRDNFYSYVVEKLDGVQMMSLAEIMDVVKDKSSFDQILRSMDAPAFSIHNPTVVGKINRKTALSLDEYQFARKHTNKPIKVALPGPYLLQRSMWVEGITNSAYPTQETLASDIVRVLREEGLDLKAAGGDFIQFDEPVITDVVFRPERKERTFMCASMAATTGDPDEEIYKASWLLNQVMRDIDGIETGVHVCRGNWSRQEGALLSGGYGPLMGYMMAIPVDQLVLEYATPRAGDLNAFAGHAKQKEIGLGVVNPRSDEIESPEYVVRRVEDALKYFDPKQVYLNPDCGFGTFAERPMNPADIAAQKLAVISQAAAILRKKYA